MVVENGLKGAPDGAEVCELVGLFVLNEVNSNFPDLDFGICIDDGLATHRRLGGRRLEYETWATQTI